MFKSLLFIGGLVCSIGLGVNNVPVSNDLHYETNETIELKANPKLASYDDEQRQIILTVDELNTYTFENLYSVVLNYSASSFTGTFINYDGNVFSFDDIDQGNLYYVDQINEGELTFVDGEFYLGGEASIFLHSIYWDFSQSDNFTYTSIKEAIELDISANSESMPQASDLFGYITQGATQFASALGQAFTSITAMIWDSTNSAPTFLGMVLLLSIGAGLIYLAFNIIRGLVRRLRG